MAETEIVRTQVICAKKVWEEDRNGYSYFLWTDENDKEYKVKEGRKGYFEAIIPNAAVQLNFSTYKGKEYVYSAEAVKDKLPAKAPVNAKEEALKEEQIRKGDPVIRSDPQRKSIERQTALKAAVELAKGVEGATPHTVLMDAKLFEDYLEFGYVRQGKLVEEAKKLGAKEVDPENMPF